MPISSKDNDHQRMRIIKQKLAKYTSYRIARVLKSPQKLGALAAGAGFFGFAVMDFLLKITTSYVNPLQVAFFLHLFAAGWCALIAFLFNPKLIKTKNYPLHFYRGLVGVITASCIITSFSILKISTVYSVIFLAPIITVLFGYIFLQERSTKLQILGILLGFLGVIIIFRPGYIQLNIGYLLALIGAFSLATNGIIIKKFGRYEYPTSYIFYGGIITAIILLYPAFHNFSPSPLWVYGIIFIGACLFTINSFLITFAVQNIRFSLLGSLHYSQIVWIFVLELMFFGSWPDIWIVSGAIIITIGGNMVANQMMIKKWLTIIFQKVSALFR